jgi:Domain of unknown function (DUF4426)
MPARRRRFGTLPLLLLSALTVASCGSPTGSGTAPQTAAPSEPTYQDFGDFELHYNALRTDLLTPEVARAYGIERSANRVLLNVSLLRKSADGRTAPVDGKVSASAHNLNGQVKNLQLRRVTEGDSVYFIGEVGISGTEILVFDISATPADQPQALQVQFKREFFAD